MLRKPRQAKCLPLFFIREPSNSQSAGAGKCPLCLACLSPPICAWESSDLSCGRRTPAGVASEVLAVTKAHPARSWSGGGTRDKLEANQLSGCKAPRLLEQKNTVKVAVLHFPHSSFKRLAASTFCFLGCWPLEPNLHPVRKSRPQGEATCMYTSCEN